MSIVFMVFSVYALAIDCPPDSAYYPDTDTTSATFGDTIGTGLCACLDFGASISGNDSTLILTVLLFDNEPLRAFQFEIIDDTEDALVANAASPGDKIEGWSVPFTETDEGNLLVFGFSFAGDETEPGTEGVLIEVTYDIVAPLGEYITFYLGGEGGIRLADADAQNVACNYPGESNPTTYSTDVLALNHEFRVLPDVYALKQNFPNPFNPVTSIEFHLVKDSQVELSIYNLLGQKVETLVQRPMPAGFHTVQWDGRDQFGQKVASGVYIYSLKTDNFFDQKKMLLLQ